MKKSLYLAVCAATLLYADAPALIPVQDRAFAQSQFMPDISLIVDSAFVSRDKDQDELSSLTVPGITEAFFGKDAGDGHSHSAYNAKNGFNLNYAELVLSSNADPFFSLDGVFHFGEEGVEIEEAYFTTTALKKGVRIRGGKFLSSFGRHNNQHHHIWDFSDAPLIYQGFLGGALNEKGLQVQYTADTSSYLMLGAELLQGENEAMFGNTTQSFANGDMIKGADAPSLFVAYLKSSFDIGDTTILPGVSYAYGESRSYHLHEGVEEAFSGTGALYNAELTIRHYFDSYSFVTWQSEWMHKKKEGRHYEGTLASAEEQRVVQEGLYTQLVYAPDQNWRMGARYDSVYKNDIRLVELPLPSTPYERYSAMLEYHFSEFSRLRLQYNCSTALYMAGTEYQNVDVQSLILSLNISIGAHAAHSF